MKISIIIPVYNGSKFIRRVLYSILIQSYSNYEVIIVDDASTDGTLDIIKEFTDPRIKTIVHSENKGVGVARQTALKNATGDFVVFVDSDDFIKDDFLQTLVTLQKSEDKEYDIVFPSYTISFPTHYETQNAGNFSMEGDGTCQAFYSAPRKFLTGKLIRKSLCDKVKWSNNRIAEDVQVLYFLLYEAEKVRTATYTGYVHIFREGSLLANKPIIYVYTASLYAGIEEINFLIEKGNKKLLNFSLNNWIVQYRNLKALQEEVPDELKEWYDTVMNFRKNPIFDEV